MTVLNNFAMVVGWIVIGVGLVGFGLGLIALLASIPRRPIWR